MTINCSINSIPNDIVCEWIKKITLKECMFFGSTCSRYLDLTKQLNVWINPLNSLGFSIGWPQTKLFKKIDCTPQLDCITLNFECESFTKLREFLVIYYQVVLNLMPKGVNGMLMVSGHGKEKRHFWSRKDASIYDWSFCFNWCSSVPTTTKVQLIGVLQKKCYQPSNPISSKFFLSTTQQDLEQEYLNLPYERTKEISGVMQSLFILATKNDTHNRFLP